MVSDYPSITTSEILVLQLWDHFKHQHFPSEGSCLTCVQLNFQCKRVICVLHCILGNNLEKLCTYKKKDQVLYKDHEVQRPTSIDYLKHLKHSKFELLVPAIPWVAVLALCCCSTSHKISILRCYLQLHTWRPDLLVGFLLSLLVYVHMSLQVNCIDELLGTQVTCNHRLPGMQESMCFQVISTCKGWTTIFTHKLLLISVSCHMSFEICTFDKCSATICALVPFVSLKNNTGSKLDDQWIQMF